MSDKEILTKAIEKAIKNGWKLPEFTDAPWEVVELGDDSVILEYGDSYGMLELSMPEIIFSHDFAKAFFGCEEIELANPDWCDSLPVCDEDIEHDTQISWEYHLQQMVINENPLQYLKDYMETNLSELKKIDMSRVKSNSHNINKRYYK